MDKKALLEFVQSLPEDVEVLPIECTEKTKRAEEWQSQGKIGEFGGIYRQRVKNELKLELRFTTEYEGQFRRTYENQDGIFINVRRIA